MNILADLEGVVYEIKYPKDLKGFDIDSFDINSVPSTCIVKSKNNRFAISKWVSPKRTRSYPFERVYDTLHISKKITVIPIIKDEGANGDRDFIQWDTISLMSLLDVYVIFAYYHSAEKHRTRENKITKQKFDNDSILDKIKEISNYHSSALHWNLKEIKDSLPSIIDKVILSYSALEKQLGVSFHSLAGIEKFKKQFANGYTEFMKTSRDKAQQAQQREHLTIQPKELLSTSTKAKVTIKNYLGGLYYLTTDEVFLEKNKIHLIEAKHSSSSKLPSLSDVKDGLLKMILYCNLSNIKVNHQVFQAIPTLKLTSNSIIGILTSKTTEEEKNLFFENNKLSLNQKTYIEKLLQESNANNFQIIIQSI